jgi:hypothetical protein
VEEASRLFSLREQRRDAAATFARPMLSAELIAFHGVSSSKGEFMQATVPV